MLVITKGCNTIHGKSHIAHETPLPKGLSLPPQLRPLAAWHCRRGRLRRPAAAAPRSLRRVASGDRPRRPDPEARPAADGSIPKMVS